MISVNHIGRGRSLLLTTLGATVILVLLALPIASAQAAFGFQGPVQSIATNSDESADTLAGSHPFDFTTSFTLNRKEGTFGRVNPDGTFKDAEVALPPGLVGDASATPKCSPRDFSTVNERHGLELSGANCPPETQVGTIFVETGSGLPEEGVHFAIYNLTPPPGVPAEFGTSPLAVPVLFVPKVRSDGDYGLSVRVENASEALLIFGSKVTFWGVPASPVHDGERDPCVEPLTGGANINPSTGEPYGSCPSTAPVLPFLTLPTSCPGTPLTTSIAIDSWEDPGARTPAGGALLSDPAWVSASASSPALTGCGALDFSPTFKAQPESTAAESPTGLTVQIHLPQNTNPEGRAESDLHQADVTLPPGLVVNPSSANGLGACSAAQIGLTSAPGATPITTTAAGAECPDTSKLGTVEIDTPLLEDPLKGSVYLAKPFENPFDRLLALYIAVDDPQTGVVVKLAGKVEPDPATGQLTARFDQNPQLPFEDLHVDFSGGARAALKTPATCGTFATAATLAPWSGTTPVAASDSFAISSGAGGSPCAPSEAALPDHPSFSAGTTASQGGTYQPFVLRLAREDGSQQLRSLDMNLPPGLLARLAGTPYCPDSGIARAESRSHPNQGALEQADPSCPAQSQVGTVTVGAGAGSQPFYASGKAYLAGPYKGAPLSLVIITPAIAGPFDLGTVVVRSALYVDESSARVTVKSDPIPTILQGIPLDIRSVAVSIDKPSFTLNPTSCDPFQVTGAIATLVGQSAPLTEPFQATGCAGLAFKPSLALSLKGQTKRSGHPALKAVLTYPKGGAYANIARAQVSLPGSEFLDQGNLNKVCKQAELRSRSCPKSSIYGTARAFTPLLEAPLEGPVYLAVGFGYKLPALVAELNGQIRVLLKGKVDTDPQHGIRNTFEAVPDAPVERFVLEMKGGKKYGLLENSENICKKPQQAEARFTAQNGAVDSYKTMIANSCGGKGRKQNKGSKK